MLKKLFCKHYYVELVRYNKVNSLYGFSIGSFIRVGCVICEKQKEFEEVEWEAKRQIQKLRIK